MKLFYARIETDTEVVITYNSYFIYIVLTLLAAFYAEHYLLGTEGGIGTVISIAMIVLVVGRMINMHGIRKEIKAAGKQGRFISVSGSQYTFNKPYTIRLSKTALGTDTATS